MSVILFILTNLLRIFGLLWIAGGLFVCIDVIKSSPLDHYIKQIDFNYQPDRQEDIFMFSIGLLTLLSGVTLSFKQDWAILFLGLLIIAQLMFFDFRDKRVKQSETERDKKYYAINPKTYNAYLTSIYVAIFTVIRYVLTIFV